MENFTNDTLKKTKPLHYRRFYKAKLDVSVAEGKLTTEDYCRVLQFFNEDRMRIPRNLLNNLECIVRTKLLDNESLVSNYCEIKVIQWPFRKEMCLQFAPSDPLKWQYWNEYNDKCLFEYTIQTSDQESKLNIKRPVILNTGGLYIEQHALKDGGSYIEQQALKDEIEKMWEKPLQNDILPDSENGFNVKSLALINKGCNDCHIKFLNIDSEEKVELKVNNGSVLFIETLCDPWIAEIAEENRKNVLVMGDFASNIIYFGRMTNFKCI